MNRKLRRQQEKQGRKTPQQLLGATQTHQIDQAFIEAVKFHNNGNLVKARSIYRKILKANPGHPVALHFLGVIAHQNGNSEEAVRLITKALSANPRYDEAHYNLGNVHTAQGNFEKAVNSYRLALSIRPDYADALINLGNALEKQGRLDDAASTYRQVIKTNPDDVRSHNNLGNVLKELGRWDDARASYYQALKLNPDYAEAHYNLGNVNKERGRADDAVANYQRAIALKPDYLKAHNNLATSLTELGLLDDAVARLKTALSIDPLYSEAYNNLGPVLQELGRLDEADASCRKSLAIDAGSPEAHFNLGVILQEMGRLEEALACLRKVWEIDGNTLTFKIRQLLLLSAVAPSQSAMMFKRKVIFDSVNDIGTDGTTLNDPFKDIGQTAFYLAYQGLNDRSLQRDIADMYLRVTPSLSEPAIEGKSKKPLSPRKRIGFLSAYLCNHTVGKLTRGLVEKLDRNLFEVVVLRFPARGDDMSASIDHAADQVVILDKNLPLARARIGAESLDLLFYPEIGMDSFTYFLAFSRLAPVQIVSWGHPVTTGIPNIDYFLSSTHLETNQADSHYSEQLIRLKNLPAYYFRPSAPRQTGNRHDFDLPGEGNLYVCPQSLFKLHPDFDHVLGTILRKDPKAWLVLIAGKHDYHSQLLRNRFAAAFPGEADRVIFVPRMGREDFMKLIGLADALLDPPHFGGGNTTYEAFGIGLPIVTWPSAFMRGRVTHACYAAMSIRDLIADCADSYADLAFRLANDHNFQQAVKKKISANSHVLFENDDAVQEIGEFFIAAINASHDGNILQDW